MKKKPMASNKDMAKWHEKARVLMREISYDSGLFNRKEDEVYPDQDLERIAASAKAFFTANPELNNPLDINAICCGEFSEQEEKYGKLAGYQELQKDLNTYFNGE
jgi:hypothetical protein